MYAMGKAVERKMGIKKKVNKDTNGKKKGNRRKGETAENKGAQAESSMGIQ